MLFKLRSTGSIKFEAIKSPNFEHEIQFVADEKNCSSSRVLNAGMTQEHTTQILQDKLKSVALWLYEHAPYADCDQRHLIAGSPEQAYWHLGRMSGLHDAIQLLARPIPQSCNTGMSTPCFLNELDEMNSQD